MSIYIDYAVFLVSSKRVYCVPRFIAKYIIYIVHFISYCLVPRKAHSPYLVLLPYRKAILDKHLFSNIFHKQRTYFPVFENIFLHQRHYKYIFFLFLQLVRQVLYKHKTTKFYFL
nr:MAG TPA: hypothetical protein [Caudoviricetes sp.]